MFFSQKDIENIILENKNINKRRKELLNIILATTTIIKLKLDTIYDKIYERHKAGSISVIRGYFKLSYI